MNHKTPIAVVKIGGDVLLDQNERQGLAQNVKNLHQLGWDIVILHGGGPQVSQLQNRLGLETNKIAGRRITSIDDLQIVKQAIAGQVNVDLVSLLTTAGLPAFGCHGGSGLMIEATRRPPITVTGQGEKLIDFGEVGDIVAINHQLLRGLLKLGQIPVIATLGMNDKGQVFNINADTTVVQIARALKAELLFLITQIGGIYRDTDDPDSLISHLSPELARSLIEEGVIQNGMIPKVEEALKLLIDGVDSIVITAARRQGVFKLIAQGEELPAGTKATVFY